MQAVDVLYAYTECKVVTTLTKMRKDTEKEFKKHQTFHGDCFT